VRKLILGAFALSLAGPLPAQIADLTYAPPIAGSWRYTPTASGSEISFNSDVGLPQLTIRCTHVTRMLTIVKPAPSPATSLWVWTSLQVRMLPATFDAATLRVSSSISAFDALADSMASSRGRIGFGTPGIAPLVVPAWGDVTRVVEDCRA
jgi:hypothetical protein